MFIIMSKKATKIITIAATAIVGFTSYLNPSHILTDKGVTLTPERKITTTTSLIEFKAAKIKPDIIPVLQSGNFIFKIVSLIEAPRFLAASSKLWSIENMDDSVAVIINGKPRTL